MLLGLCLGWADAVGSGMGAYDAGMAVHDLRHAAACWMLFDLMLDPAVVAENLGHADPGFTVKRYVGVRGNPDERAARLTEDW